MKKLSFDEPTKEEIDIFLKESSPLKEVGLSSLGDRLIVHKIAKSLPYGSVAVEIGTHLGAFSAIIAHANRQIAVHTYDIYDDESRSLRLNEREYAEYRARCEWAFGKGQKLTLDNVTKFLSRYDNITVHKAIEGINPSFEHEIDMFIEDASHKNPQLQQTLDFWIPKIKLGGFLLIHDYAPHKSINHRHRYIDVESAVDELCKSDEWLLWNYHDSIFAIFERVKKQY